MTDLAGEGGDAALSVRPSPLSGLGLFASARGKPVAVEYRMDAAVGLLSAHDESELWRCVCVCVRARDMLTRD